MELFDKGKRIFAKSIFIALAALMVGCGRNTDDVMENISGAVTGLENGENVENATNTAEKYIDEIIDNAEKEGNTEERYKAEYMRMLNYAIQNLSEAQKGLIGLQSAYDTGVFFMIQDAKDMSNNANSNNNIQYERAIDLSEAVVADYIRSSSNLNIAAELRKVAETGNIEALSTDEGAEEADSMNVNTYVIALNGVKSAEQTISDRLFADNNGFYFDIQKLFELSDDEIMAISELRAEPGYNSEEFIKEVQELANSIVDRAFNPEKDNGESEKDKDTKSSNDSKVSEDSKGSDDSIIQRRLNDFTKKWEEAWKNFKSKFNGRIAELGTQVEQNVNALEETIQEGAEERAQKAEEEGWYWVYRLGDDKEKRRAEDELGISSEDTANGEQGYEK